MAKTQDYQTLNASLDEILAALQHPDIQVDEAIKLYKQGLAITAKLKDYLKSAENTIDRLQLAPRSPK
jgi:exodeoxyribonuclease VII small subunit